MEKKHNSILRTPRLTLHPYTEVDREQVLSIVCHEAVKPTFMVPDFDSREQADAFFDRLLSIVARGDRFIYGIYLEETLIGFLNDVGIQDGAVEIGYVIHPDHWGQGFATEAVRAAIDELFRLGCPKVIAGFFAGNTASRRVMEKCGMVKIPLEEDIEYRGKTHRCLYCGIDNNL